MADKGGAKSTSSNISIWNPRLKPDELIFIVFIICTAAAIVYSAVGGLGTWPSFSDWFLAVLKTFLIVFFFTGLVAYLLYYKKGIIPMNRILKQLLWISLAVGLVWALGIYYIQSQTMILENQPILENSDLAARGFLWSFLLGFVIGFLGLMALMIIGFGMIGVMYYAVRIVTPRALLGISRITSIVPESGWDRYGMRHWKYLFLRWWYGVPEILDTRTLTINRGDSHATFPLVSYIEAMKWQIVFSVIFVIYMGFVPILLDFPDIPKLFTIAAFSIQFITVFILPWFIYLRLEVKIDASYRSFWLYKGLSYHMFRSVIAFSTVLILIRIAARDPAFINVIFSFITSSLFFLVGAFIFTFVYFNFFENDLARDIVKRYEEIRDG